MKIATSGFAIADCSVNLGTMPDATTNGHISPKEITEERMEHLLNFREPLFEFRNPETGWYDTASTLNRLN